MPYPQAFPATSTSEEQAARTLYLSLFPSFPSFPAPLAEAAPAGTVAGPIGADPTPVALVQDALRAAVVVAPVGAVEAVQAHRSAAARGMDEAALADIDADVAHVAAAAEEHQVRRGQALGGDARPLVRSEEHTSELQSLMRNSYAVFCLNKKTKKRNLSYVRCG